MLGPIVIAVIVTLLISVPVTAKIASDRSKKLMEEQIGNAEAHMRELEQIMNQLKEPNSKAEGLLLLQQNRNLFSEDKVKQLESILDGNDDKTCVLTLEAVIRIKSYWFREKEYCDTDSNEGVIRKKIIELVIKSCDSLIHKMKSL